MSRTSRQTPSKSFRIRDRDRLRITLLFAVLVHLVVILGIGFTLEKPGDVSQSLEITLSTFKSEKAPEKADFLAQDNQEGSGTLEHAAAPKTTEQAAFQDTEVRKVTPPPTPPPTVQEAIPKAAIATQSAQRSRAPSRTEQLKQPLSNTRPVFDSMQLSEEIASLEAELAMEQQQYAKRPRILRLNAASTMRDKGAWYKDEWRKKVERIGNLNYPEQARAQGIYGSLRLLVSINRDGSLYEVRVLESSGQPVLDEAAQRIVHLAAPYTPFTSDLADVDRLEIIRTWRFERGDRLSSN